MFPLIAINVSWERFKRLGGLRTTPQYMSKYCRCARNTGSLFNITVLKVHGSQQLYIKSNVSKS
jgi:hypothetical protein